MNNYTRVEPQSQLAFPLAKEGWPFIGIAAFITAVFALIGISWLALLGLLATFFIGYFFRNPDRVIPDREGVIVSPADGRIIKVENVSDSRLVNGPSKKISIFMSVFNVHVNRIPYNGSITKIAYFPGKFISANLDKASQHNEHNAVYLQSEEGQQICFVQIAGLIARRIICHLNEGDHVIRGQRFGLICFGSRLDVYLPQTAGINVTVGDRVSAGTSIIGTL